MSDSATAAPTAPPLPLVRHHREGGDEPSERCPECGDGLVVIAAPTEHDTGHTPMRCTKCTWTNG